MNPDEIYQSVLLDHYKHPRHFRKISDDHVHADMMNTLCGDHIRLQLEIDERVIRNVYFTGDGCAISIAYTSLMTDEIVDVPIPVAVKQTDKMIRILEGLSDHENPELSHLDPLNISIKYPMRSKCASLGWLALRKALADL